MGFVEGVALGVAGLVLLETVVFLLMPERVLSFSRVIARYETAAMVFYLLLGAVLMFFLLRSFTLAEIVASGIVLSIFYGVVLLPFYGAILDEFEDALETGDLWGRLAPGLLIWVGLSIGIILEWGF